MEERKNIPEPLFPFFPEEIKAFEENNEVTTNDTETIYKEIQWDYENGKPLMNNGNFVIVEGLEAIRTWCWKALHTKRYEYLIYTWDYAFDMEKFVGKTFNNLIKIEIIKEITEGLMQNKYITSVDNFHITTKKKKVVIQFDINTKYGNISDRKEVEI